MTDPRTRQIAKAKKDSQHALTTFDADLAINICERIAEGETLSAVCAAEGMPDRKTFRRWMVSRPQLRDAYDAARELTAHSLFDEAMDIARQLKTGTYDNAKVRALQIAIDTLKWSAGKLNPQQYGEKSNAHGAIAIQINTGLNLGATDRESGPAPGQSLYTVTATLVSEPMAGGALSTEAAPRQEPLRILGRPRARGPKPPKVVDVEPL